MTITQIPDIHYFQTRQFLDIHQLAANCRTPALWLQSASKSSNQSWTSTDSHNGWMSRIMFPALAVYFNAVRATFAHHHMAQRSKEGQGVDQG